MVIAYGKPVIGRITMILVVAPLVVSVIVRTYGWQLLLGNSNSGVLNWLLHRLGAGPAPIQVLFTEWAVVIASVHVFLPLMVPAAHRIAQPDQPIAQRGGTHAGRAGLACLPAGDAAAQYTRARRRAHHRVLADRRLLRHAADWWAAAVA